MERNDNRDRDPGQVPLLRVGFGQGKTEQFIWLIYQYVRSLDQKDPDGVARVLAEASHDPDLDQAIAEIDVAYQEELGLSPLAADARLIRDLLRRHLPSAFVEEDPAARPLTVGEVAIRLQADRRVQEADQEAVRTLRDSSMPLPEWLSAQVIRELAATLGVTASERFWRTFRDVAIMLGMGRSHERVQLAAAREARARYATRRRRSARSVDATGDKEHDREEQK